MIFNPDLMIFLLLFRQKRAIIQELGPFQNRIILHLCCQGNISLLIFLGMFNFSHGCMNILSILTQNRLLVILFRNYPGYFPYKVVAVGTYSSHHNFHKIDLFGEVLFWPQQVLQEIVLEQKLTALKDFDEAFFKILFIFNLHSFF